MNKARHWRLNDRTGGMSDQESPSTLPAGGIRTIWLVLLILALITADQLSKYVVRVFHDLGEQTVVVRDLFRIVYFENTGAAWGLAAGNSGILAILSIVILLIIVWKFDYLSEGFSTRRIALAMIVAGIIGNLIDRVVLGAVVDFIYLHYRQQFSWPAFNIADCGITIGVGLFLFSTFSRQAPQSEDSTLNKDATGVSDDR